jgi:hypothetical protein
LFQRPFRRIRSSHKRTCCTWCIIFITTRRNTALSTIIRLALLSYPALASGGKTRLERSAVLDWFDGRQGFLANHNQPAQSGISAT